MARDSRAGTSAVDGHKPAKLIAGLVAVGVVLLAIRMVLVTVDHSGQPVYRLPGVAVIVVVSAAALVVAGAVVTVLVRRSDIALLSALGSALVLFGILAILSVGMLLLAAGVGVFLLVLRRAKADGRNLVLPAVGGFAMACGLLVGLVVSSQGPLVRCLPGGGVSSSVANWWGGGPSQSSGSGSSSLDGTASGSIEVGADRYHYTCRNGELVTFEQQRR